MHGSKPVRPALGDLASMSLCGMRFNRTSKAALRPPGAWVPPPRFLKMTREVQAMGAIRFDSLAWSLYIPSSRRRALTGFGVLGYRLPFIAHRQRGHQPPSFRPTATAGLPLE